MSILIHLNCNLGYTGSGHYCRDVNECEINNGGCSVAPRVPCINTRVSFSCFKKKMLTCVTNLLKTNYL